MGIQSLVQCRFSNGMLMLPFFHRVIVESNRGLTNEYDDDFFQKKSRSRFDYFRNLLKGLSHIMIHRCDILIMISTLHNIESRGRKCNNLIDGYHEIFADRVLIIEDSNSNGIWKERSDYSHVSYINTYLLCLTRFLSSLLNRLKIRDRDDYTAFIDACPTYFDKSMLSRNDYFVSIYSFLMKKLLGLIKPKVLLLEDGSYGTEHAVICKIAKDRGIKVIELQHGMTYGCSAYQSLDSVDYSSEYYKYLPDCIFTFGDYWNDGIDWGYEKYSVGNAYLNNCRKDSMTVVPEYDYLILSQPFKGVDAFIKEFSASCKKGKILLRLHPFEDLEKKIQMFKDDENLILSQGTSLYDDIVNSHVVISWSSTCVYEVLAFGKVPVIFDSVMSRKELPQDIGVWIKGPEDLLGLNMDDFGQVKDTTWYWKDSFESNVRSYMDNCLC